MRLNNPVLIREMRARVRGSKSFVVHLLFLTFFLLVFLPIYYFQLKSPAPWSSNDGIFLTLLFVLLGFVCVVSPAFSSGSITGEREQKTLAFLLVAPLKPKTVVTGKMLSSFFFSALLLLTALPYLFLAYVVGGVDGLRFLLGYILILISSLFFSAMALFFSSVSRRTASATAISYGCIIALVLGTLALEAYLGSRPPLPNGEPHPLSGAFYLNPFMGLVSLYLYKVEGISNVQPYKSVPLPIWAVNMILLSLLTLLFWWLTHRRYRKLERI